MAAFAGTGRGSAALLRKVREQAGSGWPAGLVVLSGDDAFHLDAAQRAILDAILPAEGREYALTVYGDEKVSVDTVVAACRSMGMFAERRVVLVRDLASLDGDADALIDYATRPPEQSHLLIRAGKLDKRRKLHKALAEKGTLLPFVIDPNPAASMGEIKTLAKTHDLQLSREAAVLLAQVCEGDFYRVSTELAKLAAWKGGATNVSAEDLRETAAGEGSMSGWALSNAILTRDRKAALSAARRLVDSGDEPLRMLGGIAWHARTMLAAKAMLEAGRPRGKVIEAVHAWKIEDDLMRGLARYELNELLAFPAHLLAADRDLKSRQLAPSAVLESLVDRLLGTASASH